MPSITGATKAIIDTLKTDFPDVDWEGDPGYPSSKQELVSIDGLEAVPRNGHPWPIFDWTIQLRIHGTAAATELCALVCYRIQGKPFHPEMHPGRVQSVIPIDFDFTEPGQTAWTITFTVQGALTPNDDVRPTFGEAGPTFPLTLVGSNNDVLWESA